MRLLSLFHAVNKPGYIVLPTWCGYCLYCHAVNKPGYTGLVKKKKKKKKNDVATSSVTRQHAWRWFSSLCPEQPDWNEGVRFPAPRRRVCERCCHGSPGIGRQDPQRQVLESGQSQHNVQGNGKRDALCFGRLLFLNQSNRAAKAFLEEATVNETSVKFHTMVKPTNQQQTKNNNM